MSILKPLARGVVAGVAVLATTFAGVTTASADPGVIELKGVKGQLTRTQVSKYVTDSLEYQLYRELIEQGATKAQAAVLADKITDRMQSRVKTQLPEKGTVTKGAVRKLESSMERDLEVTMDTRVDLKLDRGTLAPTLDLPGGLDLAGLLGKVLGLVGSLLDTVIGLLGGLGGGGVPELPELPELPVDPELPVTE